MVGKIYSPGAVEVNRQRSLCGADLS